MSCMKLAVIWQVLCNEYVKAPSTEDEWRGSSAQFSQIWNFPNCIGAIDGKHVVIQTPVELDIPTRAHIRSYCLLFVMRITDSLSWILVMLVDTAMVSLLILCIWSGY
jgi:hypothetical protein